MSTLQKAVGEVVSDEGQAVQSVSIVFEDVVYCNICNLTGSQTSRGVLNGTLEEALEKGWKDMDWGATCPDCQGDLASMEDGVLYSGAQREDFIISPIIQNIVRSK